MENQKKSELSHFHFMEIALKEAKKASDLGEVPVGAVLVINEKIIAKAHNLKETTLNPLKHAELMVIEKAVKKIGNWNLKGGILYCTLEPCLMCAGAIILSRISSVVYATREPKFGALQSNLNLQKNNPYNHPIKVEEGILQNESSELLKQFFKSIRQKAKTTSDK